MSAFDSSALPVSQKFSTQFGKLFDNKQSCDFKFILDNETVKNKIIDAHKLVLVARSPVFEKMLSGDWMEKDEVILSDTDASIFYDFIRFLYTDEIELSNMDWLSIQQLVYLSNKYEITYLEEVINKYVTDHLNAVNVCDVFQYLHLFENDASEKCQNFIERNTAEMIQKGSYKNLNVDALKKILSFDRLSVKESQLFETILIWAELSANDWQWKLMRSTNERF